MPEIHAAMPIIHGISGVQVHRIHLKTFLQYSPAPWVPVLWSGISSCRNSVHLYKEFSCAALCYQDIIQHRYKMNHGQTLTYSKYLPNFGTIVILVPETQGPQSCPLRVDSTDPHSSRCVKSTWAVTSTNITWSSFPPQL